MAIMDSTRPNAAQNRTGRWHRAIGTLALTVLTAALAFGLLWLYVQSTNINCGPAVATTVAQPGDSPWRLANTNPQASDAAVDSECIGRDNAELLPLHHGDTVRLPFEPEGREYTRLDPPLADQPLQYPCGHGLQPQRYGA